MFCFALFTLISIWLSKIVLWFCPKKLNKKVSQNYDLKRRELGCCANSFKGVKPIVWCKIDFRSFISSVSSLFSNFLLKSFLYFYFKQKICVIEVLVWKTALIILVFILNITFVYFWNSCVADFFDVSNIYFKKKVRFVEVLALQTVLRFLINNFKKFVSWKFLLRRLLWFFYI